MAGYGTVSQETPAQNGSFHPRDEETSALLGNKPTDKSIGKRLRRHMTVNVSNAWGDIALLSCYIITGLLDSSSVFIWGSFLSMQTGKSPTCQSNNFELALTEFRKHRLPRSRFGGSI